MWKDYFHCTYLSYIVWNSLIRRKSMNNALTWSLVSARDYISPNHCSHASQTHTHSYIVNDSVACLQEDPGQDQKHWENKAVQKLKHSQDRLQQHIWQLFFKAHTNEFNHKPLYRIRVCTEKAFSPVCWLMWYTGKPSPLHNLPPHLPAPTINISTILSLRSAEYFHHL